MMQATPFRSPTLLVIETHLISTLSRSVLKPQLLTHFRLSQESCPADPPLVLDP